MNKRWTICVWAFLLAAAALALWLAARNPAATPLEVYKKEFIAKGEKLGKENWLPPPGRGSNGAALLVETLAQFWAGPMVSGVSQCQLITNDHVKVVWRYDLEERIGQNPRLDVWNAMDEMARTNRVLYSNIMNAALAG